MNKFNKHLQTKQCEINFYLIEKQYFKLIFYFFT